MIPFPEDSPCLLPQLKLNVVVALTKILNGDGKHLTLNFCPGGIVWILFQRQIHHLLNILFQTDFVFLQKNCIKNILGVCVCVSTISIFDLTLW